MFNCNGKVNSNDWKINKSSSFIQNEIENVIFTSQDSLSMGDIMLFGSVLPGATAALDLKHLGMCIEMKLKLLGRRRGHDFLSYQKPAHDQPDFYSARKDIYECVAYVRSYLNSIKWDSELMKNVENLVGEDFEDLLLGLNRFLRGLKSINDSVFHYAASNRGNESLQPDFHLYHLHLELRWLNLTLLHAKECPESYATQDTEAIFSLGNVNISSQSFSLDTTMAEIVDDLIYIAIKLFERIPLADLRTKTPYSCTCARELWLMLQIFIDDLAAKRKSKTFWQYVNNSLNTRIGGTRPEASTSWTDNDRHNNSIDCKNPEMFCLWLIYHLALLYGYNMDTDYSGVSSARIQPNYVQVEKILKVYVERGGKAGERDEIDEELGGMIPLLTTLTCEWWQPRVQIVSLLWDCFHRRLDLPFLLQAVGPWQASIDKKGPADILKQVRQRLEDHSEQNKLSSYGMFLRLLGIFLRKSMEANDSKHWNQIKGRIFSKFTKSKVEEFAEAGLYNFISLFITLALTTNTFEVCTMMLDLLPNVREESKDLKSRIVIWKGELVVLLLFAEQKINFQKIPKRFLNEVDLISCVIYKDETARLMMASYVDVLSEIFQSSDNMDRSEHSFIGGWIGRYLLACSKTRFNVLITVLNNVFDKCVNLKSLRPENNSAANGSSQMLEALWANVAGSVRLLVLDKTHGDCQSLIELAAKFTLEALRDPGMASRHGQSFSSLFKHFSSTLKVDVRIMRSYLALILPNRNAVDELKQKNSDVQVIQAWIKCCILSNDAPNKDIDYLTRYIIRSDEITKTLTSRPDIIEIENSQTPIIPFIKAITRQWNSLQTEPGRLGLGKKCRVYFEHIEKWVLVTEEISESKLTFWIYQCIGTLISYCSPMLYVKTQPKSTLIDLINKFMLPSDESAQIMNIGKRIFPLVISGIGHLDVKGDIRLQSLINTLLDKYLPYLITDPSSTGDLKVSKSLLDCFQGNNINISRGIFEKLATNFITVGRDFTTHKNCYLVIFLLKDLINRGKSLDPRITDTIISVCLPHVIVCYMKVHNRHAHRQQTIDVIAALTRSPYCKESTKTREELMLIFTSMVQRYLGTASEKLFEFMTPVCTLIPELRPHVCLKIEELLNNNKYTNSGALRFSLKQLKQR